MKLKPTLPMYGLKSWELRKKNNVCRMGIVVFLWRTPHADINVRQSKT